MMETTVVNIMDIERYQFAGVIGNDKKSIPGHIKFMGWKVPGFC